MNRTTDDGARPGPERPPEAMRRIDPLSSLNLLLAVLVIGAWTGLGALPGTFAGTFILAVLAALTFSFSFVALWRYTRLSAEERQVDWLPLTTGLSALIVGITLIAFYVAGLLYLRQ